MFLASLLNGLHRRRCALLLCGLLLPGLLLADVLSQDEFNRLTARLSDTSAQVRRNTVIQLGNSGDPQVATPLIPLRSDKDPGVRGAVASALGSMRNLSGLQTLRMLLADASPGVRSAAAEALGNTVYPENWVPPRADGSRVDRETARKLVGWDQNIGALAHALKDSNAAVRVSAAASLDALGDARGSVFLVEGMRSTDPEVRRQVYRVFERTIHRRSARVVDIALEQLPKERNRNALMSLISLLGASGDRRAFDPLVAAMKKDSSVCFFIIRNLGRLPDPRVFDTILPYRESPDRFVREAVASALGTVNDPRAIERLLPMLDDGEEVVRQAALEALSRYKDPRVTKVLLQALEDERYANRRWAIIQGLGNSGGTAALEPLLRLKDDPQWGSQAINALGAFDDPRATEAILGVLQTGNADQRRAAAYVLQQHMDRLQTPALIGLLQAPSADIRRRALETLVYKRSETTADVLLAALQDEDARVRSLAIGGLENRRDGRALPALREMMKSDPDNEVRAVALRVVLMLSSDTEAGTLFGEAIRSTDPAIRRAAVERAPATVFQTGDVLIGLLKDGDARVRSAAAQRAGSIAPPRYVDSLVALLKDHEVNVRCSAIWALARNDEPRVNAALLPLTRHADARIRETAVSALSDRRDAATRDALYAATKDGEQRVRVAALRGLGQSGDPRATALALPMLQNGSDRDQRAAAIGVLSRSSDLQAVAALYSLLKAEVKAPDILDSLAVIIPQQRYYELPHGQSLVYNVGRALAGKAYALLPLVQESMKSAAPQQRAMGVALLVNSPDPRALPVLTTALQDKDALVRQVAARALRTLGDVRALNPLLTALRDPADSVRAEAALALGQLQDTRSTDALLELTRSPQPGMRYAAVWALEKIGDPRSYDTLTALYPDADEATRLEILTALGRIGDQRAGDLLLDALQHGTPEQRACAITALGQVKEPRALEPLLDILKQPVVSQNDPSRRIEVEIPGVNHLGYEYAPASPSGQRYERETAIHALSALNDPRAIPALIECLQRSDVTLVRSAIGLLGRLNDPRAMDALISRLDTNDQRIATLCVIYLSSGPAHDAAVEPLLKALQDPARRLYAAHAIHNMLSERPAFSAGSERVMLPARKDPRFEPALRALLPKATGELRMVLLGALYQLGDAGAAASIQAALKGADKPTRQGALSAFYHQPDAGAVPVLLALLSDEDATIRYTVLTIFSRLHDAGAGDKLAAMLQDKDSDARSRAALALCSMGDKRGVGPVAEALTGKTGAGPDSTLLQGYAFTALAQVNDPRAVQALLAYRNAHPDDYQALAALWQQPQSGALDAILATVKQELASGAASGGRYSLTLDASLAACQQFTRSPQPEHDFPLPGRLGDPRVIDLCLSLLQATSTPPSVQGLGQYSYLVTARTLRQKAIWALGLSGSPRAVPALINALDAGTATERKETATALGHLHAASAVDPLIAALRRFGSDARPAAAEALQAITGQDFGSDADRWQAWRASGQ